MIGHWWQKAKTRKGISRFIYLEVHYQVRWVTTGDGDVWGTERVRTFDDEESARMLVTDLQRRASGNWAGGYRDRSRPRLRPIDQKRDDQDKYQRQREHHDGGPPPSLGG